jgi:hypothetical protein
MSFSQELTILLVSAHQYEVHVVDHVSVTNCWALPFLENESTTCHKLLISENAIPSRTKFCISSYQP